MKLRTSRIVSLLLAVVMMCISSTLFACVDNGNTSNVQKPTYNIFFYTGGTESGASQTEPIRAKEGDRITAPDDPSRQGYTFGGWFYDYNVWNERFEGFSVMPAKNLTLYAKWDAVSTDLLNEYEAELNAASLEGHLYIHYKRFDNTAEEYEKYNLWVWPKALTGVEFDWVRDSSGKIVVDEYGGATCDVDLTKVYDYAGHKRDTITTFLKRELCGDAYQSGAISDPANYTDSSIGFLIVYKSSKNLGDHWISDGGDQLVPKAIDTEHKTFASTLRNNLSTHIFATQERVYDYVYSVGDVSEVSDPYKNDDGTNVSKTNVDSSLQSKYPIQPTSGGGSGNVVKGVGYQIMVASFADSDGDGYGDIKGITQNLDYLQDLNVDVLWLTPIQLSNSYHGYDIIDYKAVDPKFGTPEDYRELLDEAHRRGMTVIMDLVLNHTSVNNIWFQKSTQLDPEYRSFYQWKNHKLETLSSSWHKYSVHDYSYYAKFATSMPELNYDYQGTRDAIVDVAKYWLAKGVDGFRIDAVKHIYMADEVIPKASDIIINSRDSQTNVDYSSNVTKNMNFFREFNARVKQDYPNAYIVGENFDGHAYNVAPYYEGMDGMLDFYMYYNLAQVLDFAAGSPGYLAGGDTTSSQGSINGQNTHKLKYGLWNYESVLSTFTRYRNDGSSVSNKALDGLFTSNHDLPRLMNNVLGSNRNGDWIAGTVTQQNAAEAKAKSKVIFSTLMSLPGISYIYCGDELGMSSNYGVGEHKHSPHADRNYRQPFKWTTKSKTEGGSTFTTSYSISGDTTYYVRWDEYNSSLQGVAEQTTDNNSMLSYVKKWTKLKHSDPVIQNGTYNYLAGTDEKLFAYTLTYNGKTYYCYHNFSQNAVSNYSKGGTTVKLADEGASATYLPAYSSIILE